MGGADLRSHSPQPDTSSYCETTDTGLVHHVVCLFTSQPKPVTFQPRRDERLSRLRWFRTEVVYTATHPRNLLTVPDVD